MILVKNNDINSYILQKEKEGYFSFSRYVSLNTRYDNVIVIICSKLLTSDFRLVALKYENLTFIDKRNAYSTFKNGKVIANYSLSNETDEIDSFYLLVKGDKIGNQIN